MLLAYLPVWRAGFIWDDKVNLQDDPAMRAADGLLTVWTRSSGLDYLPVTQSLWWSEVHVFGPNPLGYHLVCLALHIIGVLILWRVLLRLMPRAALPAALLFGLHPLCVASVSWITETKNSLSFVLYGVATWCFLLETTPWLAVSVLCYALALLAKATGILLPLALVAMRAWQRGTLERKSLRQGAVYLPFAVAAAVVTIWFQQHHAMPDLDVRPEGWLSRLAAVGWIAIFYCQKIFWPSGLCMVYPRFEVPVSLLGFVPDLTLLVVLAVAWRHRAAGGWPILLAAGWFALMLAPVSGLVKMSFHRFSLVSDHFVYLALIGPTAWLAWQVGRLPRAAALLAWGTLALALGCGTFLHARDYESPEALWTANLRAYPNTSVALDWVGLLRAEEGRLDEAGTYFERAIAADPQADEPHVHLGNVLAGRGQFAAAVEEYQAAIRLAPHNAHGRHNLALSLEALGRYDEAVSELQFAVDHCRPVEPATQAELERLRSAMNAQRHLTK